MNTFSPLFQYGDSIGIVLILCTILTFSIPFFLRKYPGRVQNLIIGSGMLSALLGFLLIFADDAHNDIYRYLWDGYASSVHLNVYETIPWETYEVLKNHEQWTMESEELFEKTGFKQYYTTYPPTMQLVLWASAEIFPLSERGLKFIFFLFFLGICALLHALYSHDPHLKKWIPVAFLSPLLLWEAIAAGHSEVLFVFFLFSTIFFWQKKWFFYGGVSLALLVWTKFFPALLGMIFLFDLLREHNSSSLRNFSITRNVAKFIAGGILTTIILWLPFVPFDTTHFFDALSLYSSEWRMFPLFFDVFEKNFSPHAAQIIQVVSTIAVMLAMIFWNMKKSGRLSAQKESIPVDEQIFWALCTYLLFASTIFSWYFLWIVPLGIFVLARRKLYILLFAVLITPLLQHFFTVWDKADTIFYYEGNGLEWEQKIAFWGLFIVLSLVQILYSYSFYPSAK